MKWSVKTEPVVELEQKLPRKDNTHGFLLRFPHCSLQPCTRTTLYTPDKGAEAEKKYHKSPLCNAVNWY